MSFIYSNSLRLNNSNRNWNHSNYLFGCSFFNDHFNYIFVNGLAKRSLQYPTGAIKRFSPKVSFYKDVRRYSHTVFGTNSSHIFIFNYRNIDFYKKKKKKNDFKLKNKYNNNYIGNRYLFYNSRYKPINFFFKKKINFNKNKNKKFFKKKDYSNNKRFVNNKIERFTNYSFNRKYRRSNNNNFIKRVRKLILHNNSNIGNFFVFFNNSYKNRVFFNYYSYIIKKKRCFIFNLFSNSFYSSSFRYFRFKNFIFSTSSKEKINLFRLIFFNFSISFKKFICFYLFPFYSVIKFISFIRDLYKFKINLTNFKGKIRRKIESKYNYNSKVVIKNFKSIISNKRYFTLIFIFVRFFFSYYFRFDPKYIFKFFSYFGINKVFGGKKNKYRKNKFYIFNKNFFFKVFFKKFFPKKYFKFFYFQIKKFKVYSNIRNRFFDPIFNFFENNYFIGFNRFLTNSSNNFFNYNIHKNIKFIDISKSDYITSSSVSNIFKWYVQDVRSKRFNYIFNKLCDNIKSKSNIAGFMIHRSGRFNRNPRSNLNIYKWGTVSNSAFVYFMDYFFSTPILRYSKVSFKIWISYYPYIYFSIYRSILDFGSYASSFFYSFIFIRYTRIKDFYFNNYIFKPKNVRFSKIIDDIFGDFVIFDSFSYCNEHYNKRYFKSYRKFSKYLFYKKGIKRRIK